MEILCAENLRACGVRVMRHSNVVAASKPRRCVSGNRQGVRDMSIAKDFEGMQGAYVNISTTLLVRTGASGQHSVRSTCLACVQARCWRSTTCDCYCHRGY